MPGESCSEGRGDLVAVLTRFSAADRVAKCSMQPPSVWRVKVVQYSIILKELQGTLKTIPDDARAF
jgi:hypothetical protein